MHVCSKLGSVQAWHDSFNPADNPSARALVEEWRLRLQRSKQQQGQLYYQYHTLFDTLVRSRMGRPGEAIWTTAQCASPPPPGSPVDPAV